MEEIILPEFVDYIVTCHTENCENAEQKIQIPAVKDFPHVVCGVCMSQIEDVVLYKAPKTKSV